MKSQQITPVMPHLYERGRQPVTFQSHKPGTIIIRVRHQDKIRYELWEGNWLMRAKPLHEYRELARQLLEVGFPDDADYRILPAKHHSLRLMWRAAREYCAGNYIRASVLVVKARKALGFEHDQSLWYGLEVYETYNGLKFALTESEVKPHTSLATWEIQADWWTSGDWPGPGLLGKMLERFTAPWKAIAEEERQKAASRLDARRKSR